MIRFRDRKDAGVQLAGLLKPTLENRDLLVLGIPRGGVPVAAEVAKLLGAELDIFLTHKLGAPFNPELAVGAVTGDGSVFLDQEMIRQLHIPNKLIAYERDRQLQEIRRRNDLYRRGRPAITREGKTVVLVDDGVATGATTIAALRSIRASNPRRVVLAVPVAPKQVVPLLRTECDQVVLLDTPEPFQAVGYFYDDFGQVTDQQVIDILASESGTYLA